MVAKSASFGHGSLVFVVCGWREEAMAGVFLRMYLVHSTYIFICTRATVSLFWVKATVVFWFWREIVFVVTYILSVQYSCVVVSVFWLWQGIVLKMRTPFDFL